MRIFAAPISRRLLLVAAGAALVASASGEAVAGVRSDRAPVVRRAILIHAPGPVDRTGQVAVVARASDPDGDRVWLRYRWYRNGVRMSASARTIDLGHYPVHRGDHIWATVAGWDGHKLSAWRATATLTVADAAPVIAGVAVAPRMPTAAATLQASVIARDHDGDSLAVTRDWSWACPDGAAGSVQTDTLVLPAHDIVHRCTVDLKVTVSDGIEQTAVSAPQLVVVDSAPVVSSVVLDPAQPMAGQTLTATPAASDADSEPLDYRYRWLVNGELVAGAPTGRST